MLQKIVTGASGRRDGYELPVALSEANLLERHVTDQYLPDGLQPWIKRLAHSRQGSAIERLSLRHAQLLSSSKVHCSNRLALRLVAKRAFPPLRERWRSDQDPISYSALRIAQRHDAALLLYAGYAYYAFMAEPEGVRPRGVVQYHPHITESARILREDITRYPFLSDSLAQLLEDEKDLTNLPELEKADLVICNSTFTAKTCLLGGVDPAKIKVIPYGIDVAECTSRPPQLEGIRRRADGDRCRFLFVGSGIHRKGLHHLLLAWKAAGLRASELVIVSRRLDPQISGGIDPGSGVRLLRGVSENDLNALYCRSDVFVMPSLVEGFGYVYLEAMRRGCFCLGTANTGLPDIAEPQTARIVPASNPQALAAALEELEERVHTLGLDRQAIQASAAQRPWRRFRSAIVDACRERLLSN